MTTPVTVIAPSGSWSLSVADADNEGILKKGAGLCDDSAAALANPLTFDATTTLAATPVANSSVVDASEPVVSTVASLADEVLIDYSVHVDTDEQLKTGCLYSTELTYTLTAGA